MAVPRCRYQAVGCGCVVFVRQSWAKKVCGHEDLACTFGWGTGTPVSKFGDDLGTLISILPILPLCRPLNEAWMRNTLLKM